MPIFSQLDVFPKYRDDVKVRTTFGGGVSICAILTMLILFVSEFMDFLTLKVQDHLIIDNTDYEKLPINFDVTFNRIPCSLISIDVLDAGGTQINIHDQNVIKTSLDKEGNKIGSSQTAEMGGTLKDGSVISEAAKHGLKPENNHGHSHDDDNNENDNIDKSKLKCGDCYGAGIPGQCCYTCDDVAQAYRDKGWAVTDLSRFEQCEKEGKDGHLEQEALDRNEGCNIAGYIEVKRGSGNFHFAPGFSFSGSHGHLHDFGAFQSGTFDTSHSMQHLSFGKDLTNTKIFNPLDNTNHSSSFEGQSIFQYYIKVVPTRYTSINGENEQTNQYSVTMHETKLKLKEGYGIPGVYIFYEFSPLMVDIREQRTPFFHFLTQVCAIIGGIFTVMGLTDRIVHGTLKTIAAKKDLGKFG